MRVREIMSAPAITVQRGASLQDALELLATHHVTALPVIDETGALCGIISELDLLRAIMPNRAEDMGEQPHEKLAEISDITQTEIIDPLMTTDVLTTYEDEDVAHIAAHVSTRNIRSVPVLRNERIIGIVSRSDVIEALFRPDEELLNDLTADLADEGLYDWHPTVQRGIVTLTGNGNAEEAQQALAVARAAAGVRKVSITTA
ncbi:CBS domain-containing protein [Dermatophilus congolensis]|uniref:Manganese-dependent inorganic pyrophosphatase n=1 Tax=Dermatophilus congolensis TaxID=1863 RepID=A0AA46H142_9MICO|nr:CBS domain-containing protein [Dermatophilus congolensis]MBO3143581.1 CBS domain-containing protein [Dermatophilus congolensis]MBO3152573.1 CBS domain-containing protein [Dermatophilus congolensis]MBO3160416.1 CBS domain-containing protein [Dermatophilus congolensis]MBO3163858.1 CBS domain-containing protein [Dermatophilus congolensis]MBO3177405.1 CBS domain-containing protein [Dermatophilus congolensis]